LTSVIRLAGRERQVDDIARILGGEVVALNLIEYIVGRGYEVRKWPG
jgi:hypothetical protein